MIWCVEDDASIRELETYVLNSTGLEACGFEDGQVFWDTLQETQPDLVILDVMLPGIDGVELLSRMKASEKFRDIPVVMATAKGTEYDKVQSLDLGADDYLVKPFGMMEMVSRVKAVLRRYKAVPSASQNSSIKCVEYPDLVVNRTNYSVVYMGNIIDMPPKELELLYFLASSPNHVYTREQLLDQIWGYEYIGDTRTVDVHIKRLREKIKDHEEWRIATIWGIGYKFEAKSSLL